MSAASLPVASFRIAVLDDNAASRVLIERLLHRHFGCRVSSHGESRSLLAECADNPPDLFLLDMVLGGAGGETGLDICRKLKATPATREVPVIFFSEHSQPRTRIEALRAGGVDYLDKPFYPEEFLQRVRGCIERFRHQRMLESQTREQQALLQVLCHDLRNSVGATLNILKMLRDAQSPESKNEYLTLSLGTTSSALDLISHVAEYRSLLDETRPLKLEPVDVAEACAESLSIFATTATTKGIRLHLDAPAGLVLTTNRVVLVHNILNNLLSNALKFSRPGGQVWLSAALGCDHAGRPEECAFIVRDEGVGISSATLEKLRNREPVTSRPGTAREPGTGLGLNLVHLYVRRCAGSLSIESQVADPLLPSLKSGTTVTVRLPLFPPA